MDKKSIEERLLPVLNYVGTIGAVLMSIAYIIVVVVLIQGFKVEDVMNITVFAVVNAAVGFVIMQFLKIQGQTLAEHLPDNEAILKRYYNTKTKDKKLHSLKFYWVTSVVKDIGVKCLTLGLSTVGVIYIVIEGNGDWKMLGLAFVNLIMFICFGLLSLNKAYEFVNNQHIPYVKQQLASTEKSEKE